MPDESSLRDTHLHFMRHRTQSALDCLAEVMANATIPCMCQKYAKHLATERLTVHILFQKMTSRSGMVPMDKTRIISN